VEKREEFVSLAGKGIGSGRQDKKRISAGGRPLSPFREKALRKKKRIRGRRE